MKLLKPLAFIIFVLFAAYAYYAEGEEVTVSASVPNRYQDFANEYCVPGEPLCVQWFFVETPTVCRVEVNALDLDSGEYMETRWLGDTMTTTIWQPDGNIITWENDAYPQA